MQNQEDEQQIISIINSTAQLLIMKNLIEIYS